MKAMSKMPVLRSHTRHTSAQTYTQLHFNVNCIKNSMNEIHNPIGSVIILAICLELSTSVEREHHSQVPRVW